MDATKPERPEEHEACPIVAIGASAGGIPALQRFFEAVPDNPGLAFIVVLHLSPSHESHLVNVLQRATALDVVQVQTTARVKPNCIYVIAPNSVLTIGDDRIRTRTPQTEAERRHPIDAIFRSLAENRNARAMCVVLSGSGSNGSAGAQAVRERDGLVLVQDPETAEHAQMPRNIILAGLADAVLPPDRMPEVLQGYAMELPAAVAEIEGEAGEAAEPAINAILSILRTRGQHDFGPYRKRTLARRIARRMGLARIPGMGEYADKLRNDPDEVKSLIGDLLINVTGFFRDPDAWATLRKTAIDPVVNGREDGHPVRAWVPACSTGEEAYTLAMLLLEARDEAEKAFEVKVFATDAAPQALSRARAGLFPATIAEAIPPERLHRYFEKEDDLYRAKKDLRESVIFAPQNLLADPPFSRLDLVSCRNLLIYLEPQVQEKVIALLHFSLREGGFLFLGSAETVGRHSGLFQPISKKWRIYRRIGATRHELIDFPLLGTEHQALREPGRDGSLRRAPADDARDAMLATFAPPSVLVDEHSQILYFHGEVDRYLTMPRGEAKLDLLTMAREELRPRLRAALRQAGKEAARIVAEFGGRPGRRERVRIVVSPVSHRSSPPRFLVSFEQVQPLSPTARSSGEPDRQTLSDGHLEEELRTAREELRLSVEQLETSNEELKASNEEITSMNEELQSTNEELETSKEELQSLNEELNTVNVQLQAKVEQLEDRTNDLNNLLNSTDIATLYLDDRFRIRWFSPPVRALFQVLQTDVGRPISDFAQRFDDSSFLDEAKEVIRTLQPQEKEVVGRDGRWHFRRILPYRTDDNRIDGVVCTFTDITERKRWEEALADAKAFAENIVQTTRQPLVVLDEHLMVRSVNRAFRETFRLIEEDVDGRVLFDLNDGDWDIPKLRRALRGAVPDDGVLNDLEIDHAFRSLGERHLLVNARKLHQENLMLVGIEDVTERKRAETHREVMLAELRHRVKNLLAKISAVITLSRNHSRSVEEYAAALRNRVSAIARTEEMIGEGGESVQLRELVRAEIASVDTGTELAVDGPPIRLTAGAAQTLALALHELATNAVKYGALSREGASLRVTWSPERIDGQPMLTIRWVEEGVPISEQGGESGFGSRLIRDVVPRMLHGTVDLDMAPDGVQCTIRMPMADESTAGDD